MWWEWGMEGSTVRLAPKGVGISPYARSTHIMPLTLPSLVSKSRRR